MWSSAAGFHVENERAKRLRHSGVQVGELIGYRAWRIIELGRWLGHDDRLRSVYISDYVWDPDKPASGDVQMHGVYSFRSHPIKGRVRTSFRKGASSLWQGENLGGSSRTRGGLSFRV